jgi:hypothetical protein
MPAAGGCVLRSWCVGGIVAGCRAIGPLSSSLSTKPPVFVASRRIVLERWGRRIYGVARTPGRDRSVADAAGWMEKSMMTSRPLMLPWLAVAILACGRERSFAEGSPVGGVDTLNPDAPGSAGSGSAVPDPAATPPSRGTRRPYRWIRPRSQGPGYARAMPAARATTTFNRAIRCLCAMAAWTVDRQARVPAVSFSMNA